MFDFFKELIKNTHILFIFTGILCVLLAFIEIQGFKVRETLNQSHWILFFIGLIFIVVGIIWIIVENTGFSFESKGFSFKKISSDKYSININMGGLHAINIIYDRIDNFSQYDKNTLVVLPANDKFDDQCIDDLGSVLGAFVKSLYPNGNDDFKNLIKKELKKRGPESFKIGNWISGPSIKSRDSEFNVGIVAVTHLIEENNIVAYSENIMLAFKGIHEIMTIKRYQKVYIPLIGSGHGGLTPELSLLCLLISTIDTIRRNVGNKLREVNIVIYKNETGIRDIPENRMKEIVKFVLNYCK